MNELRCVKCNKLLAKEENLQGKLEIKCTRCNLLNIIKN